MMTSLATCDQLFRLNLFCFSSIAIISAWWFSIWALQFWLLPKITQHEIHVQHRRMIIIVHVCLEETKENKTTRLYFQDKIKVQTISSSSSCIFRRVASNKALWINHFLKCVSMVEMKMIDPIDFLTSRWWRADRTQIVSINLKNLGSDSVHLWCFLQVNQAREWCLSSILPSNFVDMRCIQWKNEYEETWRQICSI